MWPFKRKIYVFLAFYCFTTFVKSCQTHQNEYQKCQDISFPDVMFSQPLNVHYKLGTVLICSANILMRKLFLFV